MNEKKKKKRGGGSEPCNVEWGLCAMAFLQRCHKMLVARQMEQRAPTQTLVVSTCQAGGHNSACQAHRQTDRHTHTHIHTHTHAQTHLIRVRSQELHKLFCEHVQRLIHGSCKQFACTASNSRQSLHTRVSTLCISWCVTSFNTRPSTMHSNYPSHYTVHGKALENTSA